MAGIPLAVHKGMTAQRPSLPSLPVELLQYIAILVATVPIFEPPRRIVHLLATCRSFYRSLNYHDHPQVYASIFRTQFDSAALFRRFTPGMLNARSLSEELRRRWVCLNRIRAASYAGSEVWDNLKRGGYTQPMLKEDLTTAFLMFSESDGRNAVHLIKRARLLEYLAKYLKLVLLSSCQEPVLPCRSEEAALFVWLCWFCLDYQKSLEGVRGLKTFLRPFVFGTFAYEGFHAPWPYHHIPSSCPLPSLPSIMPQPGQEAILRPTTGVFTVDNSLHPREALTGITCYLGHTVKIAVPLISQAATLVYIAYSTQYPFYVDGITALSTQDLINSIPADNFTSISNITEYPTTPFWPTSYSPPYMQTRFATITDSRSYDDEWKRLVTCQNPLTTTLDRELGAPRYQFIKGSVSGEWDGRFIKTGFDTYQRIMEGEVAINVLEQARVHHDNHSWRIQEHYHNKQVTAFLPSSSALLVPVRPPAPGPALNAHLPFSRSSLRRSSVFCGNQTRKGVIGTSANGGEIFYQTWNADTFEEEEEDDDLSDTVEILITGYSIDRSEEVPTPHHWSMLPGSTLYGTIRKWDGLIVLRASSASGSWLWRGYIIGHGANANWIGRYRVAHMDADRYGYEGVFTLIKRGAA